jgi:hypothetical protein
VLSIRVDWSKMLDKIRAFAPRKSGRLASSWHISESTDTSATLSSTLPYARIQDLGGAIPPVSGKLMVFKLGNTTIFTMKRKGFTLPGSQYTERAFHDFIEGDIFNA